ncbi:MAG: hypothetical protein LC768_16715, partial [Acidobacteria bacterium]|nr:hypothetical protein [Acidobacteriota bacterium]MCA1639942.1 hypothetical protein [Acidobacteriota bacterium]
MKSNSIGTQFFKYALALAIFCSLSSIVFGQTKAEERVKNKDFCSNNNYSNGDKAQYKEAREMTLPAGSLVNVDGKRNGGVS